jgi:hypothetical protein
MAALDRIRLIDQLRESPAPAGLFYTPVSCPCPPCGGHPQADGIAPPRARIPIGCGAYLHEDALDRLWRVGNSPAQVVGDLLWRLRRPMSQRLALKTSVAGPVTDPQGKEYIMKYLKTAFGLVVVAGLMAVVASPAMAVPRWVECVKGSGQYTSSTCTTAGAGGWETRELTGTSELTTSGELELEDTAALGGAVAVKCGVEGTGWASNPSNRSVEGLGGITAMTYIKCRLVKEGLCEELKGVKAPFLPWGLRLLEVTGEVRNNLSRGNGSGAPGWTVICNTIFGEETDTCTRTGNTQKVVATRNTGKILYDFDARSEELKFTCSQEGKETGRIAGSILAQLRSGNSLWVLAPISGFPG